jgi:hypothetical protein
MCTLGDAADVNPVPIKFLRHALQRTVSYCVPQSNLLLPTHSFSQHSTDYPLHPRFYLTQLPTDYSTVFNTVSYRLFYYVQHSIVQSTCILCSTQYLTQYSMFNRVSYRLFYCVQHSILQSILCSTQYLRKYHVFNTLSYTEYPTVSYNEFYPNPTEYSTKYPTNYPV